MKNSAKHLEPGLVSFLCVPSFDNGSSIPNISWPFAIGHTDRDEQLSFYIEETAVPSLDLPVERRKIVRGSCLSLAWIVRCDGDANYARGAELFCHFSEKWLGFIHRDSIGSLKAWPFTQHMWWCQPIVPRKELGIKLSSGCRWFFFMLSYTKQREWARSQICKWTHTMDSVHGNECTGLCPV